MTDWRLGRDWSDLDTDFRLVAGVENLFDTDYLGNLRINASNARYFEPGAERRVYAGIEISWP